MLDRMHSMRKLTVKFQIGSEQNAIPHVEMALDGNPE
jgi:hypothetical protein